jgi:molybdate transport system permease protein
MVMSAGKPIAFDSKHRIFERPKTVRVAQLTGCKNFSRAAVITKNRLDALDWGITLSVVDAIPEQLSHVGIRAHQLHFFPQPDPLQDNTFPCWLAATSETPHRMTLFLKLNAKSEGNQDYHLQAEISKEKWQAIKDYPFPWYVRLAPLRLMMMVD